MNYNLMKLIFWYFQKETECNKNINIQEFSKIIYEYCDCIVAYRNCLCAKKVEMPINNEMLDQVDKAELSEIIKIELNNIILNISTQILLLFGRNDIDWDNKFKNKNTYLLYITLYTANIINIAKNYGLDMNIINNYLDEITKNISDSLKTGMKMLEGIPQAIMRGKEVSNTYNSGNIKTR